MPRLLPNFSGKEGLDLWVGRAPTKRTYELLCFYLSGWATQTEVLTHVKRLSLPVSKK